MSDVYSWVERYWEVKLSLSLLRLAEFQTILSESDSDLEITDRLMSMVMMISMIMRMVVLMSVAAVMMIDVNRVLLGGIRLLAKLFFHCIFFEEQQQRSLQRQQQQQQQKVQQGNIL